jgi:hypothetical protein
MDDCPLAALLVSRGARSIPGQICWMSLPQWHPAPLVLLLGTMATTGLGNEKRQSGQKENMTRALHADALGTSHPSHFTCIKWGCPGTS